ncbi:MAG: hypothetical protein JNL73_06885 [Anaerolineales bacterium]|nr:hypothetical protein [Anaerolineales bacterium]
MDQQPKTSANVGVWLAIGAGIGAALMAAGLGAFGIPIGIAIGLGLYAAQTYRNQPKP